MTSLRNRITAVTVLVAVIAVVVTGLVSLQLVRSSTTQEARSQLSAQADILAKIPNLASAADLAEKASLALGGTEVALVSADGAVAGPAAELVDKVILTRLAQGDDVSMIRRGPNGVVMIEARPAQNRAAVVLTLPLSGIDRAVGQVTWRILLALGIGLVVAMVGGTLLARLLSRPLAQTAASARRLASGERGVPMPAARTTEIADLTQALATLDATLTASEGRQREFLLSISHELRTPLTALRGYGEALADGIVDDPAQVGRTLVAETGRLDHFVGDLLELARLEADDFSIALIEVEARTLLDDVVAAWSGRASTLGAVLEAHGAATLRTDPKRLRQVVDGLVENALRSGATHVSLLATPQGIDVLDDGPGFPNDDLGVVFDRGALLARYRDVRPVGTGLGLSIAVRLAARLGHTLGVANRPEGGAVFSLGFSAPAGTTRRNATRGS